jgi:ribonuclease P protein component
VLAAAQRLRRREEFAATIRGGRRAGRGALVVHLTTEIPSSPARATARAGFVVSRAVGNAVARNRVRRRLRHLVRARLAGLPAGADIVVRALPGSAERDWAELAHDLDKALERALTPGTGRRPR